MADDVTIKIGVDGKAVEPALKEVEKKAEVAGKKTAEKLTKPADTGLKRLREQARMFGADIMGRLIGAYGAMALFDKGVAAVSNNMARLANISRESKKAGISAEDYQRLGKMADVTGVNIETLGKSMEELRELQAQAVAGNEKAIESLIKLGYSQQQAARGGGSLQEVLLRVGARYRAASSDAERLAIAMEFLGKKQGVNAGPLLGASPAQLATAAGAAVVSQAESDREAARERQSKREEESPSGFGAFFTNVLESLDLGDRSIYRGKFAITDQRGGIAGEREQFAGMGTEAAYGLRGLQAKLAATTDEGEKERIRQEMLSQFSKMADDFRFAFTGTKVDGVMMTAEQVEKELDRKLKELMPEMVGGPGGVGAPGGPGAATEETGPIPAIASSLAAIGGGGGVYGGVNDMVTLADRTANATERTAAALETLLNNPTTRNAIQQGVVNNN